MERSGLRTSRTLSDAWTGRRSSDSKPNSGSGTLWDGRFRSCLVDSAGYVLACYRYIELNPVRAGMVTVPSAYKWSSYAGNAGMRIDRLLTAHPEFTALSSNTNYRQATYRG